MPDALVSLDQFAVHPYPRPPPFLRTATDGTLSAQSERPITEPIRRRYRVRRTRPALASIEDSLPTA